MEVNQKTEKKRISAPGSGKRETPEINQSIAKKRDLPAEVMEKPTHEERHR